MPERGQRNHLGVNQTTLREDRNCMNVPSNVKWRIFYIHFFCLCVFTSLCFCCCFLFFFYLGKHKKLKLCVQAERSQQFIRKEGAWCACWCVRRQHPVNVGNDPNLPHADYQYMVDTHFCFIVFFFILLKSATWTWTHQNIQRFSINQIWWRVHRTGQC